IPKALPGPLGHRSKSCRPIPTLASGPRPRRANAPSGSSVAAASRDARSTSPATSSKAAGAHTSRPPRLPVAYAPLALVPALLLAGQDDAADQPRPLLEVHFDGLQRYAHDGIVRFAGLEIGQPVTEARLTSLAQQLADSGLFTGIRYQYTTTDKGLIARFTVAEPQWTVPVIFDNFIGISDEELIAAVARYVPSFDGTAVADGATNNLIGSALQHVLTDLGRPGRIVVIPRINIEENWTRYA